MSSATKEQKGKSCLDVLEEEDLVSPADALREKALSRKIEKISNFIRANNDMLFNMGAPSLQEYKAVVDWLDSMDCSEKALADLRWFVQHQQNQIRSAERLTENFLREIKTARSRGIISDSSVEKWLGRFASAQYKEKEFFVEGGKLKQYLSNAEAAVNARKTLIGNPRVKKMTPEDVPGIALFLDEEEFLNMPYDAKKNLLRQVRASLYAKKSPALTQLYKEARKKLEAHSDIFARKKIGTALSRIFAPGVDQEKAEAGVAALDSLLATWGNLCDQFAAVEARRNNEGSPRGFRFVKQSKFVDWNEAQCKSYLEVANKSFSIEEEHPLLLNIRSEVAVEDWESAEYYIRKAGYQRLSDKDQQSISQLKQFIRQHRRDTPGLDKKGVPPNILAAQTLDGMRAGIAQVPASIQTLYINAINGGYASLMTLCSIMGNRVWWHEQAGISENQEIKMVRETEERKSERKKLGKSEKSSQDWEAFEAYHTVNIADAVEEIHAHKEDTVYQYYKTYIPEGVNYETHAHIVKAINPILKSGMRTLHALGCAFTLIGPPVSVKIDVQNNESL